MKIVYQIQENIDDKLAIQFTSYTQARIDNRTWRQTDLSDWSLSSSKDSLEPRLKEMYIRICAPSEDSYQPAHPTFWSVPAGLF